MEAIYIILGIVVVLLLWVIITYNNFIVMIKGMEQSKSAIDVYLKQRFDLIPNLIECVKAYMNYEKSTFEKITELRNEYNKKNDFDTANKVNSEYNKLILLAEQYPDLKADSQFSLLQKGLVKIESQLQAARRIYNGDVTMYNAKTKTIPSNIIANIFNFKEKDLFEIAEDEAKNININM